MEKKETKTGSPGVRRWQLHLGIIVLAIALSFWMTADGPFFWDDPTRKLHSDWLLGKFGLRSEIPDNITQYYAPLWELILGIASEFIFFGLRDPYWVRHAMTFALYPLSFYVLFLCLRRSGISRATTVLALSGIFGCIRLGGHALFNVKDVPGALSYLLASVGIWMLLKRAQTSGYSFGLLALLGMISVIPFLMRSPLLTPAVFMIGVLLLIAVFEKKLTRHQRIRIVAIPLFFAFFLIVLLTPPYWTPYIWGGWFNPLSYFTQYSLWQGKVVFYGTWYDAARLPWWYPFAWIPIIMHPLSFGAAIAGIASMFWHHRKTPAAKPRQKEFFDVSLTGWLGFFTLLSWTGIMVLHPKLYNEERHILFLFPITLLFCFLGFENIRNEKLKYLLSVLIVITSGISYWQWGRYSYVYKSPLIGQVEAGDFSADYWGACLSKAFASLKGKVPDQTTLISSDPEALAPLEKMRLTRSLYFKDASYEKFMFASKKKLPSTPYVWLFRSDFGKFDVRTEAALKSGRATLLWDDRLPSGEMACSVLYYH